MSDAPTLDSPHAIAALPPGAGRRSTLRGREKAAALLVSLGPERAADLFRFMSPDEIETLSLEMAKTRQVPSEEVEGIFGEVIETNIGLESFAHGGVEFAREVLEKALGGERAKEIIGRLSAVIEMRPFEFLRRTPPEQIFAFLRNEAPQTIALVIANLHTTLAAQVLSQLPDEEQAEVARRIATMGETSPEVIKDVETVLRTKLSSVVSQEYSSAGGVKSLADILNHADRPTERNILDTLGEHDQELAEEIRRLLFVFEDVVKLDDRSIQLILKDVDQKDLALALRGVAADVQERILSNMSQRGAEMLREEMQYMPPQRRSVVEEAQGRIVGIVRKLEEAGAIILGRGGGGDEDLVI